MAKAAPTLKRISLELGGKSPNIVFRMLIWQQQWAVPSSVSTSTAVRFVKPVPTAARVDQRRVHAAAATKTIKLGDPKDPQLRWDR